MYIDNGGSAFPSPGIVFSNDSQQGAYEGMTLRAYIATKCCAAMVSSIKDDAGYCRLRGIAMAHGLDSVSEFFAMESCKQADALIAELAK